MWATVSTASEKGERWETLVIFATSASYTLLISPRGEAELRETKLGLCSWLQESLSCTFALKPMVSSLKVYP